MVTFTASAQQKAKPQLRTSSTKLIWVDFIQQQFYYCLMSSPAAEQLVKIIKSQSSKAFFSFTMTG